ncbi:MULTISPECIES: beta-N-acetylhexosaminidase [unclassified Vibrio]|uniref:beta-N-acetylhexosaminidase n=1 Tax=Vibrio sp. HB236076 TaxID=3232307 RepID=A0AB39HGF3_9VIBR|nr:beta-N-acetylhexosaminidase [Vibrio sp. HB161653]MDP5254621.1 beta-N-acetylhexosaminidase [Vibrio sp. HB161653]
MGPLWIDVAGYQLSEQECLRLQQPIVGGVILFARNHQNSEQLKALTTEIRRVAKRPILIGVDQEGGRVQRFKQGFTRLPSAFAYHQYDNGLELAKAGGYVMASELLGHGIDLSFAPVLDVGQQCLAIGDRSFGQHLDEVRRYSRAFLLGMKEAGMATTGKHFPGHGGVVADSHLETPFDHRNDLFEADMTVFQHHIEQRLLDAMMPAHVVYPHYDSQPASGSGFWLKTVLRQQLGFDGVVFSDDLAMKGASFMGSPVERARQALDAGCDMILVCNDHKAQQSIIDELSYREVAKAAVLLSDSSRLMRNYRACPRWQQAQSLLLSV